MTAAPLRHRWLQARHTLRLKFHKEHTWHRSFDIDICVVCGAMREATCAITIKK